MIELSSLNSNSNQIYLNPYGLIFLNIFYSTARLNENRLLNRMAPFSNTNYRYIVLAILSIYLTTVVFYEIELFLPQTFSNFQFSTNRNNILNIPTLDTNNTQFDPNLEAFRSLKYEKYSTVVLKSKIPKDPPGIAWLLSYPNSGTSYTLQIVKESSDFAIATNYGTEANKHLLEKSIPIHKNYVNGPFRTNDRNRKAPKNYVLTKTHCGGRCVRCSPRKLINDVL